MKLSQAILKGCENTTKIKFELVDHRYNRACAIGAAIIGSKKDEISLFRSHKHLFTYKVKDLPDPLRIDKSCDEIIGALSIYNAIICLNDHTEWSREKIASWLSFVEDHLDSESIEDINSVENTKLEFV